MKKYALIGTLALLAACNQGQEAAAPEAGAPDLAASVGSALVTTPEGVKVLSYSAEDGTLYGGPVEGDGTPATWSVDGDKTCLDPPGDEEKFCFTYGKVTPEGAVPVIDANGRQTVTFTPLGTTLEPGTTPAPTGGGASLIAFEDGTTGLSVFTEDGKAYLARNPQKGTWRAVDGKRCIKSSAQAAETCATPGKPGADGSFTATSDPQTLTVQPLG
jgi:hypothetical protein